MKTGREADLVPGARLETAKQTNKFYLPHIGRQLTEEQNRSRMSRRTWILKTSEPWTEDSYREGADLNVKRIEHSCGMFTDKSGKKFVVAAGGFTGFNELSNVKKIEMYDIEVLKKIFGFLFTSHVVLGKYFADKNSFIATFLHVTL